MLTASQIDDIWTRKLDAETRSLYFGDLANRYSIQKQWITGISFFLASGAAATLIGKLPVWLPIIQASIVALLNAYTMAVGLERRVRAMAKLHSSWLQIGYEYSRLWNHTFENDAASVYEDLIRREGELSELATTEAPNDQKLLGKWQDRVFQQYYTSGA